ncbi:peptidylprolyl isomerase [Fodinibius sp.]|uniref:peptidylprolyl isomerase n=1 Tax=Fodinibius sp. TaxID=1872440 RepID=UPI002ACE2AB2|nr:peptidylprolyl isomerase [Fodinibius sp.]MDZ7660707.1 peptidylprolyl isomerase [Fodinibius sp.]
MKYVRLRSWIVLITLVVGVIILFTYSRGDSGPYKSANPITDSLLTATYPVLYEAVTQRDIESLEPFLSHEHPEVRKQAWRAFANTPIDSVDQFIDLAIEQNSEASWFGISKHAITGNKLRELEQNWIEHAELRSGISRVLGRQGDEQTLSFLVDQLNKNLADSEYHTALAVGRLIQQFDVAQDSQIRIIQKAFDTENYEATRAYLYGWYRGDESELSAVAQDTLFSRWQLMGTGISRNVDQYVNKILPERTTHTMTIFYNGEQMLDHEVQLAYELATSIGKVSLNDQNSLAAKILLTNENAHVQVRTLESLRGRINEGDDLYQFINEEMLTDERLADAVWLQALATIQEVDNQIVKEHHGRLETISEKNPYLWPEVLGIYQQHESTENYLQRIGDLVSQGEQLPAMYALQSLRSFVQGTQDSGEEYRQQIRTIVFDALDLGDRGVSYMAGSLLENESLFGPEDFDRINGSLSTFSLPGDIEVYQIFGSVYKERFEEQAEPVIDSLASKNYVPLNRSLADAGWEVEVPEESKTDFRLPDWDRLWELGPKPTLLMQTEKGRIHIEMNTLSAPATVAMIDSLNRAGHYDDVPFHRVVPNFVIQGGDIERQDGFGGPDFVIPTEASQKGFVRGSVGIASAGPDTEGSQYFMMHQWKPHLNGNYTLFGKVTDGMDVVDKIVKGDKVLSTTWY